MTDDGTAEMMTWALSVIHAAVLSDDEALTDLMVQRVAEVQQADPVKMAEQLWLLMVSLVQAGTVYALMYAQAVGLPPEEVIAAIGSHAAMWENGEH